MATEGSEDHRTEAAQMRYLECLAGITSQLLPAPDPWAALPGIIKWLRETADASRCRYYEFHVMGESGLLATKRFEAVDPVLSSADAPPDVDEYAFVELGLGHWIDVLSSGNVIHSAVSNLSAAEQEFLKKEGVEYILVAPLLVDDDLVGYLSLDICQSDRQLGQLEASLLRSAANVISHALKRQSIERGLRKAHALLASILRSTGKHAIIATDLKFRVLHYNPVAEEIFGYTAAEVTGRNLSELEILDSAGEDITSDFIAAVLDNKSFQTEFDVRDPQGQYRTLQLLVNGMESEQGTVTGYILFARDISEELKQQRRSLQSERMESIGLLAGGIAHDFNNILMGILGYSGLAKDKLAADHPVQRMLSIIEESGERAAALTNELLAYARGGKFQSLAMRLDEQVNALLKILGTSLPENVQIERELADELPYVIADPVQIQQVIMNICLNAGDAIKELQSVSEDYSGRIVIRTGVAAFDRAALLRLDEIDEVEPGNYVFLAVEDNGCGMDEETRKRIFEPFFTTKFTGRGLGLAAAEGIIRNHGGFMLVESTPNVGSRFTIYLPESNLLVEQQTGEITHALAGAETILFVDDEEIVRQLALLTLTNLGYNVLLADDGQSALEVFGEHSDEIDLVLLDLGMPGMSGDSLIAELNRLRPAMPTLATSGYDEVTAMNKRRKAPASGFLQKPYTPEALSRAVRQLLDNGETGGTGIGNTGKQ